MFEHSGSSEHVENVGTGIKDPLSELVYRVHPLPESMTDHLFGEIYHLYTSHKHCIFWN